MTATPNKRSRYVTTNKNDWLSIDLYSTSILKTTQRKITATHYNSNLSYSCTKNVQWCTLHFSYKRNLPNCTPHRVDKVFKSCQYRCATFWCGFVLEELVRITCKIAMCRQVFMESIPNTQQAFLEQYRFSRSLSMYLYRCVYDPLKSGAVVHVRVYRVSISEW